MDTGEWAGLAGMVILPILVQSGLVIWKFSNMSTRVDQLEEDKKIINDELKGIDTLNTKIAVIETKVETTNEILRDIQQDIKGIIYGQSWDQKSKSIERQANQG